MGALCYKDCNNIGLVNCGIGACASSSSVCGIDIGSIAINFGASLIQAVGFVASFGANSAMTAQEAEARQAVVKAFQSSSKSGIKEAAKQAVAAVNRMGKDVFVKKMIKSAALKLGEAEADAALSVACNAVATQVISNLNPSIELRTFSKVKYLSHLIAMAPTNKKKADKFLNNFYSVYLEFS